MMSAWVWVHVPAVTSATILYYREQEFLGSLDLLGRKLLEAVCTEQLEWFLGQHAFRVPITTYREFTGNTNYSSDQLHVHVGKLL